MVILITGASHTGKTLLAQKMLERYRFPYLCIDHLKMGLIRSGRTNLTPEDDDALVDCLWPIVREIIKTAIENEQNLIVEGCYVPFDWRSDFTARYLRSIRFICLAMSDDYIAAHASQIAAHASDIEARQDDSYGTVDWLMQENRRVREGFLRAGEPVAQIESDYTSTIEGLL